MGTLFGLPVGNRHASVLGKEAKMRKIFTGLIVCAAALLFSAGTTGCAHHYRHDGYYMSRGQAHRHTRYIRPYKYERKLLKQIRKNEHRIYKLERKIDKLCMQGFPGNRYRRYGKSYKLRHLQKEIRRLERINRYLRRKLRR